MKYLFLFLFLLLSGCVSVPQPMPAPMPIPFCKKDQNLNCRKMGPGDMGGTVRGNNEEIIE